MTNDCLIRHASAVLTGLPGEHARLHTSHGDVRVRQGKIHATGALEPEPGEGVYDASNCVLAPGWVNTHHHLFQNFLKGVPAGPSARLADWLAAVPVRHRQAFDYEAVFRLAVRVGLTELLLSGCTTVADHQHHCYCGMPFDATAVVFDEAEKLGMRMAAHPCCAAERCKPTWYGSLANRWCAKARSLASTAPNWRLTRVKPRGTSFKR